MPTIVTLSSSPVTASTVINRAFRIVNTTSESPTATETTQCLEVLNAMIDSWRNENLMCWSTQDEALTLVANQQSYSVGNGGDLNSERPVRIDSAYVIYNSVTFPIDIYTDQQWASIPYKAQTSNFPTVLYYQPLVPLGYLWPYPIVNGTGAELHIITHVPFAQFTLSTTTAYLPPGWSEALATNLAIAIAPEYQKNATPDMIQQAKVAKGNIKRINNKTPIATFDGTLLNNRYYNWRMGNQ